MSFNPLADDSKLRAAIQEIHGELRDRLGPGVTLADVRAKLFEVYGVDVSEEKIAPYLAADALASRRAQGATQKVKRAHALSDLAAEASANARADGSPLSHHTASAAHADAADACKAAMEYHIRQVGYHSSKAAGENPAEMDDE